jgi:hypothetical protein
VIALFAVIIVAAFLVFRSRGKVSIKGPFGTGLDLDASNEPKPATPGVTVKDAKSRQGGLLAEDRTGRGADVEGVEVHDDILVTSTPPQEGEAKKAPPPA